MSAANIATPVAFAYVITVGFEPQAADTVVAKYREQTAPLVTAAPGLRTMFALVNRQAGRGMTVRAWQTAPDRARSDLPSAAILDDFAGYASLLTGPYTRDPYDVTVHTRPSGDPRQLAEYALARVTTMDLRSDHWDDGLVAIRALARQTTRTGVLLCEHRGLGRVLLLEVAKTHRQLAAGAAALDACERAARHCGQLRKPFEYLQFEVVAHY